MKIVQKNPVVSVALGLGTLIPGALLAVGSNGALTQIEDVALGQVLISQGAGVPPTFSADPIVSTLNHLTLTRQATGFTIAGGTTSKTLTLNANLTASTALSLTGTSNRISITGSTTLSAGGSVGTIDISTSYVGQTSITTLGTITTGTWHGSVITPAYGGTGAGVLTAGSVVFAGASGVYSEDNSNLYWDDTNNRLGLFTNTPSTSLSFGGNATRIIGVERHTTADTAGGLLAIIAGGATTGATNKDGGNLQLRSGLSTGSGTSSITFLAYPGTAAATTDNTFVQVMTMNADGLGIGVTTPTHPLHIVDAYTDPSASKNSQIVATTTTLTTDFAFAVTPISVTSTINQAGHSATTAAGSAVGIIATATSSGSTGTTTAVTSYRALVSNTGAGTLTNGYGYYAAGPSNSGGGTFTTYHAFYQPASSGGASVYRAFESDLTAASTRWNLYMGGTAQNYLAGNLGIGITAPTVALDVSGVIQATTSLIAPLVIGGTTASSTLTLESTSGTGSSDVILFKTGSQVERMRITTDGLVGIGGTPTVNQFDVFTNTNDGAINNGIKATYTATLTGNSAAGFRGIASLTTLDQAGFNASASPSAKGFQSDTRVTGSSGTVTFIAGIRADAANIGTGTVTSATNYFAGGPTNTGGGTLTNAYALYVEGFATATNNAAIRINNMTAASTRWAIYSDGTAQSTLGGNLGIGVTSPTVALDVVGAIQATSTINALTLTALSTGFTIAGGTTSKTLTVDLNLTASTSISVAGTSNRITTSGSTTLSAGGTVSTIDIAATYVGQTSITTLGTIATGTWQATKIGLAYGGTNADLSATGGTSQVLKQTSTGAAITVAQLAASDLSNGTTGSGAVVLATSPTISTSLITPLVIGGTTASSTLTLESTSGVGTTDAILFLTGSQAEAMRITTGGLVGIGVTPTTQTLGIVHAYTDVGDSVRCLNVSPTLTFTGDSTGDLAAIIGFVTLDQAGHALTDSSGTARGLHGAVTVSGATGTVTKCLGVQSQVFNTGAGTITAGTAYHSAGPTNSGGGTYTLFTGYDQAASTGATTLYAFRGQLASNATRWNLYMDGTAQNYLAGNLGIGVTSPSKALDVSSTTGFVSYASGSTSSAGQGTNWLRAPKNTVTLFVGDSDSTSAYTADELSGNIRFNGTGVAWGDFGYYPTGGDDGSKGHFRLSLTGSAIDVTPDAKLGVGKLYAVSNISIGSTTPLEALLVNNGKVVLDSGNYATSKFNSQGVDWATFGSIPSVIFNADAADRPEIAWIRGSRTYPEFAIRQHTTNDTGGEFYVGPGTAAPTLLVAMATTGFAVSGDAAKSFAMNRHTTSNTAGNSLTIQSGGATSGATDKAAGDLILKPGLSTSTAVPARIRLQGTAPLTASGTTDQTNIDRYTPNAFKVLTNNSATTVCSATVATATGVGIIIDYCIEVIDGSSPVEVQTEVGRVYIHAQNKNGTVTAVATETSSQQSTSTGTLATTWAVSSANPAVISVNANSSLTPATNYPRVSYSILNLGSQSIT